jgi:hypothetical protein
VDDLEGPINGEWIERNVKVDRVVEFGSDEYWDLTADPEARVYLQGGPNVTFAYQGEVIAVQDAESPVLEFNGAGTEPARQEQIPDLADNRVPSTKLAADRVLTQVGLLVFLAPVTVTAALIVLFALGVVVHQGLGR